MQKCKFIPFSGCSLWWLLYGARLWTWKEDLGLCLFLRSHLSSPLCFSVSSGLNSLCLCLPLNLYDNQLYSITLHVMIFFPFNIVIPGAPLHRRDSWKAKTPHLLTKELLNPKHFPLFFINLIENKALGSWIKM